MLHRAEALIIDKGIKLLIIDSIAALPRAEFASDRASTIQRQEEVRPSLPRWVWRECGGGVEGVRRCAPRSLGGCGGGVEG
eukprot:2240999-Pyramimonas_sp.AAC.1